MPDIRSIVIDALADALKDDDAAAVLPGLQNGDDLAIASLNLDSLSRFEVMMKIEDALDVELDDDEMLAQGSVNALIAYLEAGQVA